MSWAARGIVVDEELHAGHADVVGGVGGEVRVPETVPLGVGDATAVAGWYRRRWRLAGLKVATCMTHAAEPPSGAVAL